MNGSSEDNRELRLVAWRCALASPAARYARLVRELTVTAAAVSKKKRTPPHGVVLSIMGAAGGDWQQVQPKTRERLGQVYEKLGLKLAARELDRVHRAPAQTDTAPAEPGRPAIQEYLVPPESAYDADEAFEQGLRAIESEQWDEVLRAFRQACRLYRALPGLHELHAADCLLNMSTAAIQLNDPKRAMTWALKAQFTYERWARIPEAAKAMMNRLGILCRLEEYTMAFQFAGDITTFAAGAGVVTAAADARAIRLATEAAVKPRRGILEDLERIRKYYGEGGDPSRQRAFESCYALAKQKIDLALAKQDAAAIFSGRSKMARRTTLNP